MEDAIRKLRKEVQLLSRQATQDMDRQVNDALATEGCCWSTPHSENMLDRAEELVQEPWYATWKAGAEEKAVRLENMVCKRQQKTVTRQNV